mmetsp:Transcript_57714/g.149026  ORF Transcript_57714/g.149026 Transcript_57714/m.149026 type:complete len:268 (+) Transcript_57714:147-950(+)
MDVLAELTCTVQDTAEHRSSYSAQVLLHLIMHKPPPKYAHHDLVIVTQLTAPDCSVLGARSGQLLALARQLRRQGRRARARPVVYATIASKGSLLVRVIIWDGEDTWIHPVRPAAAAATASAPTPIPRSIGISPLKSLDDFVRSRTFRTFVLEHALYQLRVDAEFLCVRHLTAQTYCFKSLSSFGSAQKQMEDQNPERKHVKGVDRRSEVHSRTLAVGTSTDLPRQPIIPPLLLLCVTTLLECLNNLVCAPHLAVFRRNHHAQIQHF